MLQMAGVVQPLRAFAPGIASCQTRLNRQIARRQGVDKMSDEGMVNALQLIRHKRGEGMYILIAERDINGRRMLNRILTMEGYQVAVATSGDDALRLLNDVKPSIVLMNVFQCMGLSGGSPGGKMTVRHCGGSVPALLATCSEKDVALENFMTAPDLSGESAFDFLPPKVKSAMMERIQQMCAALRQCGRLPAADGGCNRQDFVTLMERSSSLGR